MSRSKSTVIRDLGGGLNVTDDDLNLASLYQTVLDNIHRGVDNTLSVRWGTSLFADMRLGTETTGTTAFTVTWTNGSRAVQVDWTSHGFVNGQHITFTSAFTTTGLINAELIGKPLGVRVVNANQFFVYVRTAATANGNDAASKSWKRDGHNLAGNILEIVYYSDFLIVFDDVGEIVKINGAGTVTRIFDVALAFALSGTPIGWVECDYVSTAIFKGDLLAVNGKDKPLKINLGVAPAVQFLVDIPSGSNANTPIARYILALNKWVIMAGDPVTPYRLHISNTNSSGTWVGDAGPNDAIQLDLNNTNSSGITIRGINKFREFLAVAFDDTVTMVELGIFNGAVHTPEITDSIARHGAIAHKSMIFLGFDLVMADPIGVPSFAKSQFDSSIIPSRMSEFIAPLIQNNISRLQNTTLDKKVFALYSTHDNRYLLFVPNYDNTALALPVDPLICVDDFVGTDMMVLNYPNHGMEEGDQFTLAGVAGSPVTLPSTCKVYTVIDWDHLTFKLDSPNVVPAASTFGGAAVTITRLKTETTVYAFTYNKNLKIKAWSRYRGWNFNAATTTLYGRVFLATNSRVWKMGNRFEPIYADFEGNYDRLWGNNVAFTIGQKAKDTVTGETYIVLIAHTSAGAGTFAADRAANPTYWELYLGEDIAFIIELPWADFDKRDLTKYLKTINVDAKGTGRFTLKMFVDYFYKDKLTGERVPLLSMDMVGGDESAFGLGSQSFGAGRIATRQRPWPFEARGKLFKLRIEGATKEPLRFVAFIFGYKILGKIR